MNKHIFRLLYATPLACTLGYIVADLVGRPRLGKLFLALALASIVGFLILGYFRQRAMRESEQNHEN